VNVPVVIEVVPVIAAPPEVTIRPFVIVSLATVREPMYALEVLSVVVDNPPCRVVRLPPFTVNVPVVIEVLPVIAAPPEVIIRPVVIVSLATVRDPMYALEVLIVVVDNPPCRVVRLPPFTVNVPVVIEVLPVIAAPPEVTIRPFVIVSLATVREPIYALLVLIVVVDNPPCRVVRLPPFTVNVPVVIEVLPVIAAPPEVIIRPFVIVSLATVRELIYALLVLIVVVDKPPCKVVKFAPVTWSAAPVTVSPRFALTNPPTARVEAIDSLPTVRLEI
jgi:hypothetical protein